MATPQINATSLVVVQWDLEPNMLLYKIQAHLFIQNNPIRYMLLKIVEES